MTLKSLVKTGSNGSGAGPIAQGRPITYLPAVRVNLRELKDDGTLRIEAGECEIDFGDGELIFTELLTDAIKAEGDVVIIGCGMIDMRGAQSNCIRSNQGGQVVFRVVSAPGQILLAEGVSLNDLTDPDAVVIEDSFNALCGSTLPPCAIPTVSAWGAVILVLLLLTSAKIHFRPQCVVRS
jgi:hypothetical protein